MQNATWLLFERQLLCMCNKGGINIQYLNEPITNIDVGFVEMKEMFTNTYMFVVFFLNSKMSKYY